jgi:hypothetical protein
MEVTNQITSTTFQLHVTSRKNTSSGCMALPHEDGKVRSDFSNQQTDEKNSHISCSFNIGDNNELHTVFMRTLIWSPDSMYRPKLHSLKGGYTSD